MRARLQSTNVRHLEPIRLEILQSEHISGTNFLLQAVGLTSSQSVDYPYGSWTITDASLSPDNKWLAYSSIRSIVCLANTDPGEESEPHMLEFANTNDGPGRRRGWGYNHFGVRTHPAQPCLTTIADT